MIIIRYREIGLKGKNRRDFEQQLQKNVKHCLKKNTIPYEKVQRTRGKLIVYTDSECDQLKYVYGISSFSSVKEIYPSLDEIKAAVLEEYKGGTFKVKVQRSDKILMSSVELAKLLGEHIVLQKDAKVDIHNPNQTIFVDLANKHAYIYSEKVLGPGGLPCGSAGRVSVLLQNKNSIKAAKLVMKRGCTVDVVKEEKIDWSELHNFEYGFTIKELESIPQDTEAVVVSDTIDSIKNYSYFVLRPLI